MDSAQDIDPSAWLARASAHRASAADARVAELFASARIECDGRPARQWEATGGLVRAYRVVLVTTARSIAHTRRSPAVMDAVTEVLSSAVSADKGAALDSVNLRWGRVASEAASYRETTVRDLAIANESELRREALVFLRATDASDAVIDAVQRARLSYDGRAIVLRGIERDRERDCARALRGLTESD